MRSALIGLQLVMILSMITGCATQSTLLLDEYIDISRNGKLFKKHTKSLSIEIQNLIYKGDSLITVYEDVLELGDGNPYELTRNTELFVDEVERIEGKLNKFNLNLRLYDKASSRFLCKINHSKYRRRIQRAIYRFQSDIDDAMIDLDHELLSSTQRALIELVVLLESQSHLIEMNVNLDRLESLDEDNGRSVHQ